MLKDEGKLLNLVGKMQENNLGEGTGSAVEEEQAADQGQGAEETSEETKEERSKRKAPDSGPRRSHRLGQRPRGDYSNMVFSDAPMVRISLHHHIQGGQRNLSPWKGLLVKLLRDLESPI